jgi:hypothetical protein
MILVLEQIYILLLVFAGGFNMLIQQSLRKIKENKRLLSSLLLVSVTGFEEESI